MPTKTTKKQVKKTAAKRPVARHAKTKDAELKSFRLAREKSFFSFKISIQTVYWSILILVIIVLQLLIVNAQLNVANTNDELTRQLQTRD